MGHAGWPIERKGPPACVTVRMNLARRSPSLDPWSCWSNRTEESEEWPRWATVSVMTRIESAVRNPRSDWWLGTLSFYVPSGWSIRCTPRKLAEMVNSRKTHETTCDRATSACFSATSSAAHFCPSLMVLFSAFSASFSESN
jgi:hypothetical protein